MNDIQYMQQSAWILYHSDVTIAVLEAISGTIKGHETMCLLDVLCRNIFDSDK